jgi:hypothetical protein
MSDGVQYMECGQCVQHVQIVELLFDRGMQVVQTVMHKHRLATHSSRWAESGFQASTRP